MLGPNEVSVFLIAPAECILVSSTWQTLCSDGEGMHGRCTPLSSSWTQLPMLPLCGFIRKKMGFKSTRLGALCALQGRDKASLWFQPKSLFCIPTSSFFSSQDREIITNICLARAPQMERWFANHVLKHQRIFPPFSATCMQSKRSDLSPSVFFFWNRSGKLPNKVQEVTANDRLILWVWMLSYFQGWIWIFFFWSREEDKAFLAKCS